MGTRKILVMLLFSVVATAQIPSPDFEKAETFRREQKTDSAIAYYRKAVEDFRKTNNPEGFVNSHNAIGALLTRQDRYAEAKRHLDESLAAGLSSLGENHLAVATTYINLGVLYAAEDQFEQSLIFHNKSLAIRLELLGENSADVATSYCNIGNVHFRNKSYDDAISVHEKALSIRMKLFGNTAVELIQSYVNLGNAYREKKAYKNAIAYFEKALEIVQMQHRDLSKYYRYLSEVYYLSGDISKGDFYKTKASQP